MRRCERPKTSKPRLPVAHRTHTSAAPPKRATRCEGWRIADRARHHKEDDELYDQHTGAATSAALFSPETQLALQSLVKVLAQTNTLIQTSEIASSAVLSATQRAVDMELSSSSSSSSSSSKPLATPSDSPGTSGHFTAPRRKAAPSMRVRSRGGGKTGDVVVFVFALVVNVVLRLASFRWGRAAEQHGREVGRVALRGAWPPRRS